MATATSSEYDNLTLETDVATTDVEEVTAVSHKSRVAFTVALITTGALGVAAYFNSGNEPARVQAQPDFVKLDECSPPANGFDLPHKGCGSDGDASTCLANNERYYTLGEAWEACGRLPECGVIMRWTDGVFYLRRSTDPDMPVAGAASMLYSCRQTEAGAGCVNDGDNCMSSRCCNNLGSTCYRKNENWASCNASCTSSYKWVDNHWQFQGPGAMVWGCEVLGCCKAATAECLSCTAGKTVAEFCAAYPGTVGCNGDTCCADSTAECLACAARKTVAEFCAENPITFGCAGYSPSVQTQAPCCMAETAECLSCSAGMTVTEYCAEHPGTVGCIHAKGTCCAAETAECLSCIAGQTVTEYCAEKPGTVGCPEKAISAQSVGCSDGAISGQSVVETCCEAETAECLSCAAGLTVHEFCVEKPDTVGCLHFKGKCCTAETAECLSCSAGKTVTEYCAERPGTDGCVHVEVKETCCSAETSECLACAAGQTEAEFCAEKPTTVGCEQACCKAETAECLSCAAGMTLAVYCAENPGTDGCAKTTCCDERTAKCLACAAGLTEEEFCAVHPGTKGCCCAAETAECLACAAGQTEEAFCAGHPNTVGCCCTAETAECLSCAVGQTVAKFCAVSPKTVGCPQVKKKVQEVHKVHTLTCSPPKFGFDLPHKGCGVDGDASACVAENQHFSTLDEAWEACGRFPACGVITKWTDNMYYLRRLSDPDEPVAGSKSLLYRCVEDEEEHETKHYTALSCPPPESGFDLPHRGCHGRDNDKSGCIANNAHFSTLGEAWQACGEYSECDFIMRYTDGMFYLRSSSDKEEPIAGAASMRYRCEEHVHHRPLEVSDCE